MRKGSTDSSNQLLKLETRLIDSNNAINLILSKNIEVDKLDMSIMEANKEIELLQSEQTSKENELRTQVSFNNIFTYKHIFALYSSTFVFNKFKTGVGTLYS